MSDVKTRQKSDVKLGTANPMAPEVFADHVAGIKVNHGVGRILLVKHRPVAAVIDKEFGVADTPAEAGVLMMPTSGLRELKEALDALFTDSGDDDDSD